MKRVYHTIINEHLRQHRQMVFIAGPRQVGKTTISLETKELTNNFFYLNWDNKDHQKIIIPGPKSIAQHISLDTLMSDRPILVLDEIHKYSQWKQLLKGFFDTYEDKVKIIVTGSAKLNLYKAGGDSLMGRYLLYRVHPLSIAELISQERPKEAIQPPRELSDPQFQKLKTLGGFPEPLLKNSASFHRQWSVLRQQQIFAEDIRVLTDIHELAQMEMMAELLKSATGQLLNYSSLANAVNVSVPTIQRWMKALEACYFCYTLKPWFKNIKRSLVKTPKIYLWDWSLIQDKGAHAENFVASHLLKAVHFWTDLGFGYYDLFFVRDKSGNEVDFLITQNNAPWILIEVKNSKNRGINKALYDFQKQSGAPYAFQVTFDAPFIEKDCFAYHEPIMVPALTFLSQLV